MNDQQKTAIAQYVSARNQAYTLAGSDDGEGLDYAIEQLRIMHLRVVDVLDDGQFSLTAASEIASTQCGRSTPDCLEIENAYAASEAVLARLPDVEDRVVIVDSTYTRSCMVGRPPHDTDIVEQTGVVTVIMGLHPPTYMVRVGDSEFELPLKYLHRLGKDLTDQEYRRQTEGDWDEQES
jgi:hypothetical protein